MRFTLLPKQDKSAIIEKRICVKADARGGERLKQQVSPGIIAVAVVVVLGLIGAMAYMILGRHQDAKSALNSSNPNYEKYMNGSGSGGGSAGQGSPNSAGSPGSSGSPYH
jgi:hypothetical protein